MKKRGKRNIQINISNRVLYTLITLGIIAILSTGVYAVLGTTPNPGHPVSQLQPCSANEILKMNAGGNAWECTLSNSQWTTSGSNIYYNTGNVGIGTANPLFQLSVISQISTVPRGISLDQYSTDTNGALVNVRKARGTLSSPIAISVGDPIGNFMSWGYDGTNFISGARIRFVVDGSVSGTIVPTDIEFFTGSTNGGIERMRISSSGNVGIGTVAPVSKLDVNGAVTASGGIDAGGSGTFLKIKVLPIGDWNMIATGQVQVQHGLTLSDSSKIVAVQATIRNDIDSLRTDLSFADFTWTKTSTDGMISWTGSGDTTIGLQRRPTGTYVNALYDSTSYNRGWVTIFYLA